MMSRTKLARGGIGGDHCPGDAAVAQDGDPVGDALDLVKVMRDEQDAGATLGDGSNEVEEQEDLVAGQEDRRLVENQQRLPVQRLIDCAQSFERPHDGHHRALDRADPSMVASGSMGAVASEDRAGLPRCPGPRENAEFFGSAMWDMKRFSATLRRRHQSEILVHELKSQPLRLTGPQRQRRRAAVHEHWPAPGCGSPPGS